MKNYLGNTWWIAIGIQIMLVVWVLLLVIPYVTDRTLAEQMGDPGWFRRNSNAARQLIPYLQTTLQLAAVGTVVFPVLCTAIWFMYLWFKSVEAPGEARRAFGFWFLLGAAGMVVCFAFGVVLLWTSHLQILANPDLNDIYDRIAQRARVRVVLVMLVYFWISYYVIGTLFTTPPLFRPAVPLASLRRTG
jgi:hypothetical protein